MTPKAQADARRAAHRDKWRAAHVARAGWTGEDHEAEAERIESEIAAMIESGQVTQCPPDAGLVGRGIGSPEVAHIMAGWVVTPTQ